MWNPTELENHDPKTSAGGRTLEPLERLDALIEDARLVLAIAIPSLDRTLTLAPEGADADAMIEAVEGNIILLRETMSKLCKAREVLADYEPETETE